MTYKATFKCTQCGHIYEGLIMEGDFVPDLTPKRFPRCPECGGEPRDVNLIDKVINLIK
ncbi:MAG: hypothetical protein SOX94_06285 [Prevotella sp.]|nr:hypothetical protein [Prevotella sp.]